MTLHMMFSAPKAAAMIDEMVYSEYSGQPSAGRPPGLQGVGENTQTPKQMPNKRRLSESRGSGGDVQSAEAAVRRRKCNTAARGVLPCALAEYRVELHHGAHQAVPKAGDERLLVPRALA